MLKELAKIANELDGLGLIKEADHVDLLLKRSYAQDPFQEDTLRLAAIISEGSGRSQLELQRDFWVERGPRETMGLFAEEASEVIMGNPDTISFISFATKAASIGAIMFPEPATTAAGVATLRGSAALDILAAIGYFKQGQGLNGWFSILSAILFLPAGPALKAFMFFRKLRNSGQFILMAKSAPLSFTSGLVMGIEGLLDIVKKGLEEIGDDESNLGKSIVTVSASQADADAVKGTIKQSGEELSAELRLMKAQIESPDQYA
jgi:hypothetical protein